MAAESDVFRTLADVHLYVRRFVVVTDPQAIAIALWVFHTWAAQAAESTPYLSITSALPRSGKSRLLEVLELLVKQPMVTANISDAALFRAVAKMQPTLLFDEIDSVFGPKARDREDLRGMLNAGYRRGALAHRMGGANNRTLESFEVYCCKAFAGIGELPTTIRDRSIRIRLERRIRGQEHVERFRRRDADFDAEPIRDGLASLADHHANRLMDARPVLPDELDDRAQDVWEPLLAIAELAGEDWGEVARKAALELSAAAEREDDTDSVRLLADIATVFEDSGVDAYSTPDLIGELAKIEESPWGDWYGKTITPQGVSKLLRPYRIRTMAVWVYGNKARGYKVEQFADAWLRVLGGRGGRGGRSRMNAEDRLPPPTTLNSEGGRSEPSVDAAPTAPTAPTAYHAENGHESEFPTGREWLAHDGVWRRFESEPPVFPTEIVETRGDNQ